MALAYINKEHFLNFNFRCHHWAITQSFSLEFNTAKPFLKIFENLS